VLLATTLQSLIGCSSFHAEDDKKAQLHLQMGASLLSEGNNPQALKEFLEAERLDSKKDPNIQQFLGMAYMVRDRYKESESHFLKALRWNPKFTEARYNYSQMLIQAKRYDDALKELMTAKEDLTYSQPEQILTSIGFVYFKKHEYTKAAHFFQQSLVVKENDCVAETLLGRAQLEMHHYQESTGTFDTAIKLCRDLNADEPLFYSGLSYFKIGDRTKALSRLDDLTKKFENSQFSSQARILLDILR
jgi:Tfp pilus assembly protein PilF